MRKTRIGVFDTLHDVDIIKRRQLFEDSCLLLISYLYCVVNLSDKKLAIFIPPHFAKESFVFVILQQQGL